METTAAPLETTAPPRGLPIRWNFAWTLAGNVVYAACQWGMLVALAKLGSPEMVGQFALGLAIGGPVMMLANLHLRAIQATDARDEFRFGDYLGLRVTTTVLGFLLVSAIAIWGGYRWPTALVIILVGAAKSVESVSDVIYGVMQKYERLDRIATAVMIRGLGSVALFALALWLTGRVAWAVTALAVWWAVVLLGYERRTAAGLLRDFAPSPRSLSVTWDRAVLFRLARLAFPLGIVMVLVSLNTNIPRYFVERYHGEAALGYFAALGHIMVAGYTVMGALGQSASQRLARDYISDRAGFNRLMSKMLMVAGAVGAGGIIVATFAGRWVLTFLYRSDYAEHAQVFVWVMVAAAVNYLVSMLGWGMAAARIFQPQVPLFATACLGIVVTCALLVPSLGLLGAALALVVGGGISAVGGGAILALWARPGVGAREVART